MQSPHSPPEAHRWSKGAATSAKHPAKPKVVSPNQKAIDALPSNSGDWKVEGVPGLSIRCRAQSKTFRVERRINGVKVTKTLDGITSIKQAKIEAMRIWSGLKPKPAAPGVQTLGPAIEAFLE